MHLTALLVFGRLVGVRVVPQPTAIFNGRNGLSSPSSRGRFSFSRASFGRHPSVIDASTVSVVTGRRVTAQQAVKVVFKAVVVQLAIKQQLAVQLLLDFHRNRLKRLHDKALC